MKLQASNLDEHPVAKSSDLGQSVPVIDLGDDNVVGQIATAAREWGFFQITHHGIPGALVNDVVAHTKRFFSLPVDEKNRVRRTRDNPWGYYNNELTKNQRDKKEVFDFTTDATDPIYQVANRWPEFDIEFRRCMEQYLQATEQVAMQLVEAFATGLGLEADALHSHFLQHTSFVRLNFYPVNDPLGHQVNVGSDAEADLGVHHHSDAGALTLLLQHEVSGLQVHKDGQWHNIPPLQDALVINTGDMMQVWSNDIYQAPIHRVLAMNNDDRISIPLFFNPGASAVIRPLPTVISDDRPAAYEPIQWAAFRQKRTDGDYADYGSEVQIRDYRRRDCA